MYQVYWLLHVFGIVLAFLSLGGLAVHVINGGGRDHALRAPLAAFHGAGLVLALVGGFGMQARGELGWPVWMLAKIALWVVLGAVYAVLLRKPQTARLIWWSLPVIALVALALVAWKPFA